MTNETLPVSKVPSGITGFDTISHGGLPKGRITLVSGTVGSGKTVFAVQFLAEGIMQRDEHAVFVTFEEPPAEIRRNVASLGWDIAAWEEEGKWAFVDASLQKEESVVIGKYDLKGLLTRIGHAVAKIGASRVSLDSIGAIVAQLGDATLLRREIYWVLSALRDMDMTGVITAERDEEYGNITNYGLEAFVADNVVILRNPLEEMMRRRTIEVVKLRGTTHQKREYPFTVVPGKGIIVVPFSSFESPRQQHEDTRVLSGITGLDPLCGGGVFRNSVTMISGPSGTGKTVMATQFITSGCASGERGMMLAFEESRAQLHRNALGWGVDLRAAEADGNLKLICQHPEESTLEDTLAVIKLAVEEFSPDRLVVDSLSALERTSSPRSFSTFATGLTSFAKQKGLTTFITNTAAALIGGSSITEARISTLSDVIILLRYVELNGRLLRAMTVVKHRGSEHDKNINEYVIGNQGVVIGRPFRNVTGILTGNFTPHQLSGYAFFEDDVELGR